MQCCFKGTKKENIVCKACCLHSGLVSFPSRRGSGSVNEAKRLHTARQSHRHDVTEELERVRMTITKETPH